MRVLVVDDEPLARRRLVRMLARLPEIDAVGQAGTGAMALSQAHLWDVLLLDIAMAGLDGLAVARAVDGPAVIFTTAHDAHALEAFEVSAVDYLLKPVELGRLARALRRVAARRAPPRVVVRGRHGVHAFSPEQIEVFRAVDKVTTFEVDGREHVVDESLSTLEARLPGFVRVHRGELVRLAAVARLASDDEGAFVALRSGARARVSRRQLPTVRRRLDALGSETHVSPEATPWR